MYCMNMYTQLYCGARGLNVGMNLHLDPSMNMHQRTQLYCGARGQNIGMKLYLDPYFVCANREISSQTADMQACLSLC